ncbi:MAG: protein-glutamate O-methyltransferase CheR [Deltaproteobacteria bacterium]|nr:protein-glutamate O-methyltransferase CheR [Deltaproteobacteria bacterium]
MTPSCIDPFEVLRALIFEHSGIRLTRKDDGVLKARVARRLRALRLGSAVEYLRLLRGPDGPIEIQALLDAVTINYTFFFREPQSFQFLTAQALPELLGPSSSGNRRRVRVWSAGCSSGEEPYSIAMTLAEAIPDTRTHDFRVLATDINRRVLTVGAQGVYPQSRVTNVPQEYRSKYLTKDAHTPPAHYRMCSDLRAAVAFRRLNILDEVSSFRGVFDAVFCRNVMIYFDEPTKVRLLRTFHSCLVPGGHLLIGASETLSGLPHPFLPVGPSAYRRR